MKIKLLVLTLIMVLGSCTIPTNQKTYDQNIGKITSTYCHNGDIGFKTDLNFEGTAITPWRKCPTIDLNANVYMSKYANGDCWIYFEGAGQSFKCH